MMTVQELLRSGSDLPTDSARRDTEVLLGYCLGKPRAWLYTWPDKEVSRDCARDFETLLAQRREGLPVAYLTGEREFWSLQLSVSNATLIPRPETETLVAWALELELPHTASVLDLGTGSGAIALALASEKPRWHVTALDVSKEALQVARRNAVRTRLTSVRFVQSDWYQAVKGQRFNALLGNPPYIDEDDPHLAFGDVRFEPRSALVSSNSGLEDLGRLVRGAPEQLLDGGWLLLEHGFDQSNAVSAMLHDAGFSEVITRRDMSGQQRITGGCWHAD